METFISKLKTITGVSRQYAVAAWCCLSDNEKDNPRQSAKEYARKFNLIIVDK